MIPTILANNVESFLNKNLSNSKNVIFSISVIALVLLASSQGGLSINSKAISPSPDTIFYRINTNIHQLQIQIRKFGINFLKSHKKGLSRKKCYLAVDETHDSYTGGLIKKEKRTPENLTSNEKYVLKYIHKYQVKRGDTGNFKYVVIALIYGNRRQVLDVKAVKRKEKYKDHVIKRIIDLKKYLTFECVLFDRGFYDGFFIQKLKDNNIPFIIRARISDSMKKIYGFYITWRNYGDYEIGEHKIKANLILGLGYFESKYRRWAFISNLKVKNWKTIKKLYKKRWDIENIFKATDGIQLKAQTNNPVTRLFCVCLSFLFYNAWQRKNKRKSLPFSNYIMKIFEKLFDFLIKSVEKSIEFYRDRLKINIPFWKRIIHSC